MSQCYHPCYDCQVDTNTINEYYMVHDSVWYQATTNKKIMLCIGCLEIRLGRQLNKDDFTDYPVNRGIFPQSDRLKNRLTSVKKIHSTNKV